MVAPPETPEILELYAVEPEAFVTARTALVRRLRATGRRPEAAVVAKLRRPTPGAWALDRVAREQPNLLNGALAAGAALRGAMEEAVLGDASGLRDATRADRAATDALLDVTGRSLGGRAATLRPKLAATVRAAVLNPDVASALRRGVLAEDHDAPGFGLAGFAIPDVPSPARPAKRAVRAKTAADVPAEPVEPVPDPLEARRAARDRRKQRSALEAEADRQAARARSLAHAAGRAAAAAVEARAEADAAQAGADGAADALAAFDAE